MNRIAMKLFAVLLIFFSIDQCCAEGFAAGTLVKVSYGYKKIEDVRVGDYVICCDKEHNLSVKPVFFNGKNYISPDADGHNGGLWKIFDRRGKILYTASRRFEKIVKIYE